MSRPKPGEDGLHKTYCRLCEAQCGLLAEVEDGEITAIHPDREHPVSRGHLCVKAPGMLKVTYDADRVLTPLKRSGAPGEFEPVSWDEALDDIAARLKQIKTEHRDAIASYIGNPAAFATMHYAYGFGFVGMLGSNKMYNAQHVDTGARTLASDQVFGGWCLPFPDLPDTEMLLMFGANPLVSHMSLICAPRALEHLDAVHKRGAVVVVDPRRTETARRYEHQPLNPDSDVWLLIGLLKTLIEEHLTDERLLAERVVGWEMLAEQMRLFPWQQIEQQCGIDQQRIRELARRFAAARAAACYGRVGTNRGRFSTLSNILMDAMNLATGNFGVPGGSVVGISPFASPRRESGYGQQRSRIGNLPLVGNVQPGGGLADEILTPGAGQIRALILDSGNPVLAYPDGDKAAEALESLELFVALDFYVNESSRHADYILPVPTFYERPDVNDLWAANAPEPWVQYVDAVILPLGEARHEYEIYDALLERLELPDPVTFMTGRPPEPGQPRRSYLELTDTALRVGEFGDQFGANAEGLNLEKLLTDHPSGLATQPRVDAARTWERVVYDDGKPRLWTELIESECQRLIDDQREPAPGELKLFGRRLLHSMNSWMHNSDRVIRNSKPTLLMHPVDAEHRQIRDGQRVRVSSKTGEIEANVQISDEVITGSVNYPHGFGHNGNWQMANGIDGANVNLLASSDPKDWEPVSGNCHLDGIPVQVAPLR